MSVEKALGSLLGAIFPTIVAVGYETMVASGVMIPNPLAFPAVALLFVADVLLIFRLRSELRVWQQEGEPLAYFPVFSRALMWVVGASVVLGLLYTAGVSLVFEEDFDIATVWVIGAPAAAWGVVLVALLSAIAIASLNRWRRRGRPS